MPAGRASRRSESRWYSFVGRGGFGGVDLLGRLCRFRVIVTQSGCAWVTVVLGTHACVPMFWLELTARALLLCKSVSDLQV